MGFEDRDYYREPGKPTGFAGVLHWLLYGKVRMFRAFGIVVHIHSSLIILLTLWLLIGFGQGYTPQDRLIASAALFTIILLHEFGHCFAARYMNGEADEIIMHPLGGVALTRPPHHWFAHFVTVAGGPMVNVIICIVTGIALFMLKGSLPWKPFYVDPFVPFAGWWDAAWWCYWIYQMSWTLLLFNLMPIFPLDGGQLLQSVLWKFVGYRKATILSCNIGMVAAVVVAAICIATLNFWLLLLCVMGFLYCSQLKRAVLESDPYDLGEPEYASSLQPEKPSYRERRQQEKQRRAEAREAEQKQADEQQLDAILAKISSSGKDSLSRSERKFLERVTEEKRKANETKAKRN
jgi:stage IV sporulation protein FB